MKKLACLIVVLIFLISIDPIHANTVSQFFPNSTENKAFEDNTLILGNFDTSNEISDDYGVLNVSDNTYQFFGASSQFDYAFTRFEFNVSGINVSDIEEIKLVGESTSGIDVVDHSFSFWVRNQTSGNWINIISGDTSKSSTSWDCVFTLTTTVDSTSANATGGTAPNNCDDSSSSTLNTSDIYNSSTSFIEIAIANNKFKTLISSSSIRNDLVYVNVSFGLPSIIINNPINDTISSDIFDFSFDEEIDTAIYWIDSGSNVTNTTLNQSWIGTLTGLSDGQHNITVWANDTSGNNNQTVRRWTRDTTPPILNITEPQNTTYANALAVPKLNFTNDSILQNCKYSLNGASNISISCLNDTTTINAIGGLNSLTFSAEDLFGNENTSNILYFTVTSDNSPPVITIVSPDNITYINNTAFNLFIGHNITSDENLADANFSIDNSTLYLMSNTSRKAWYNDTITFNSSDEGNHFVEYQSRDTAGNVANDTIYFTVAFKPSKLENITIGTASIERNEVNLLSLDVIDSEGNLDTVTLELSTPSGLTNFTLIQASGNTWSRNFGDTSVAGTYSITNFIANDTFGAVNVTSGSGSFTVRTGTGGGGGGGLFLPPLIVTTEAQEGTINALRMDYFDDLIDLGEVIRQLKDDLGFGDIGAFATAFIFFFEKHTVAFLLVAIAILLGLLRFQARRKKSGKSIKSPLDDVFNR